MWIDPKTDWMVSDTIDVKTDLYRISGNILYLQQLCTSSGYLVQITALKYQWAYEDFIFRRIIESYASSIENMFEAVGLTLLYPMDIAQRITADLLNAIERNTFTLKNHLENGKAGYQLTFGLGAGMNVV